MLARATALAAAPAAAATAPMPDLAPAPAPAASTHLGVPPPPEAAVAQLMEMGFVKEDVLAALEARLCAAYDADALVESSWLKPLDGARLALGILPTLE